MTYTKSIELAGKQLTIETGKLAQQADGAVTVRYGDTVILATAVASKTAREGIDFFPLTVEYEERHYAVGRIPGSFFRREGRPTTEAILTARLVDRPIRPLFPKGFRNEVQIIVTTLSTDQENDPDVLAILGASAALSISDIPFGGPVAGVRIGRINGRYVVNPTFSERDDSDLDLVVAGTADAIMMVEAGASQVEEAVMLEGLRVATEAIREMVELQEDLVAEVGRPKREIEVRLPDPAIEEAVRAYVADDLLHAVSTVAKQERNDEIAALRNRTLEHFLEQYSPIDVSSAFEEQLQRAIRGRILELGARPDGRRPDEIRPISCEVGLLPRTHGSGLFSRGETQVLTMATLGSKGDAQRLDTLEPISSKRFMHHYNFPPFSTGETGRVGSPRRREIGHGALGERALEPVIPPEEDFPYTIRLVSEVLS
ncbi:MAG TPA: polyribonucleotide nucleotidyltransferase, partial [Dehalococcoidia bacterium]|nr:polyribonucleotide nucleotidyltransferase [Dehalococcoidia bacterium]